MTKKHYKHIIFNAILFAIFCFPSSVLGQQIKAKIIPTGSEYHRITIPQEFRSLIGNALSNIRIKDKNGHEVPYIYVQQVLDYTNFVSVAYDKISTDSTQTFIIPNTTKKKISNYVLEIANTNVSKNYSIEGSHNKEEWFALENHGVLGNLQSPSETSLLAPVHFPLNDYAYIRICMDDKRSAPINVLNIGYIEISNLEQDYVKLKDIRVETQEIKKEKLTRLQITKAGRSSVDIIQFHLSNTAHFTRPTRLYSKERVAYKKKEQIMHIGEYDFNLANTNARQIEIPASEYPQTLYIDIKNDDNPPLQIDSISLFQKPLSIVALLQNGEQYTLEADSSWTSPTYDLAKLNMDFSKVTKEAKVTEISMQTASPESASDNKTGKIILIIGCIAGVAVLFFFGASLIKDMKKE